MKDDKGQAITYDPAANGTMVPILSGDYVDTEEYDDLQKRLEDKESAYIACLGLLAEANYKLDLMEPKLTTAQTVLRNIAANRECKWGEEPNERRQAFRECSIMAGKGLKQTE